MDLRLCKCGQPTRGHGQRDCHACHRDAEARRRQAKWPSMRVRKRLGTLRRVILKIKTKNSVRNRALLLEAIEIIDSFNVPKWKHEDLP